MSTASPFSLGQATGSPLVKAKGRNAEIVAFEASLVALFTEGAEMLGVQRSVAAIYAICFASAEPLSFVDIEERLDISRGSISQGLRILREVGALRVVPVPIERREFFSPDLHLRNLVDHWLETRLKRHLEQGRVRLQVLIKSVPPGRNGSAKVLRARVKTLQGWNDKARALMPFIRTFLKIT